MPAAIPRRGRTGTADDEVMHAAPVTTTASQLAVKLAELETKAKQEVEAAKAAVRLQEEEAAVRRAEVEAQVMAHKTKHDKAAMLQRLAEEKEQQLQVCLRWCQLSVACQKRASMWRAVGTVWFAACLPR